MKPRDGLCLGVSLILGYSSMLPFQELVCTLSFACFYYNKVRTAWASIHSNSSLICCCSGMANDYTAKIDDGDVCMLWQLA